MRMPCLMLMFMFGLEMAVGLPSPLKISSFHRISPTRGGSVKTSTTSSVTKTSPGRLEVGIFFGIWYGLNVAYNVANKKVLRAVDLPWMVALSQLIVGTIYANVLWITNLRTKPKQYMLCLKSAMPIAVAHGAGQACTVMALGAGAVSSAHVIKALEPLFSALMNAALTGERQPTLVYLSLLPVVGGVALAVAKDLAFSPLGFGTAMSSNVFFAARATLSKIAMQELYTPLTSLSPASLFGIVTTAATLLTIPIALFIEAPFALSRLEATEVCRTRLTIILLASGLFHYLNNEVMYLTLRRVHPITLAVGNSIKRVVLVIAALIFLGESMQPLAAVGASIAITGTLTYAILKQQLSC